MSITINRRHLLALACVGGTGGYSLCAAAQSGPMARIVVPSAPGAGTDIIGRRLAEALSPLLQQPTMVENKAGARNIIGTAAVAKGPLDGNTLLIGTAAAICVEPAFTKALPYDPIKDLTPVALLGTQCPVFISRHGSPFASLQDVIRIAKQRPGEVSAGYSTSTYRLLLEILQKEAGIALNLIPYKSAVDSGIDILGGRLDFGMETPFGILDQIRTRKFAALAVTDPQRNAALPEVPTVAELGFAPLQFVGWTAVFVRSGVAPERVKALEQAVLKVSATPEFQKLLTGLGVKPSQQTTSAFQRQIVESIERYKQYVDLLGLASQA